MTVETAGAAVRRAIAFGLLAAIVPFGLAYAAGPAGLPNCAGPFDPGRIEKKLAVSEHDASQGVYAFYPEPCDGGLYMLALGSMEPMTRVNESWWLEELESVQWADGRRANEIVVTASYITGIGPTGVQPFRARIVLKKLQGAWVPQTPEAIESKPERAADDPRVHEARSPAELARLEIMAQGRPVEIDVNFEEDRLVAISVWLTSGSIRITDVHVRRSDDRYYVDYDTTFPPIGTTDMKSSVIFVVLPKDGRQIEFGSALGIGRKVDVRTGIIDRAGIAGAPPPR